MDKERTSKIYFWNLEIQVANRLRYINGRWFDKICKNEGDAIDGALRWVNLNPERTERINNECLKIKEQMIERLSDYAIEFFDYGLIVKPDDKSKLETYKFFSELKLINVLEPYELLQP